MVNVDINSLKNTIISGDKWDWTDMFSDLNMLIEEIAFMFKNPNVFTENERYDLIEQFRQVCKCFSDDRRATGTLMKDLDINE